MQTACAHDLACIDIGTLADVLAIPEISFVGACQWSTKGRLGADLGATRGRLGRNQGPTQVQPGAFSVHVREAIHLGYLCTGWCDIRACVFLLPDVGWFFCCVLCSCRSARDAVAASAGTRPNSPRQQQQHAPSSCLGVACTQEITNPNHLVPFDTRQQSAVSTP